jgi:hypothetical protein
LPWGLEPVWACPKVMTLPWPVRFMSTNEPNVVKTLCPSMVIKDNRLFQDNRNPWWPIHQLIAKKGSMYSTSAQVCNRVLKMLPKIYLQKGFPSPCVDVPHPMFGSPSPQLPFPSPPESHIPQQ